MIIHEIVQAVQDEFASAQDVARRTAICENCRYIVKGKIDVCGACGCPIYSKTRFQRANCPLTPPRW